MRAHAPPCHRPDPRLIAALGGRRPLTELNLRGNALTGAVPPALAALPALVLDLGANRLGGQLPGSFVGNAALREVWLDGNQLEGPLPQNGFIG
jgi:hypothetical protein